jgi:cation diffusion facilitator family transporter
MQSHANLVSVDDEDRTESVPTEAHATTRIAAISLAVTGCLLVIKLVFGAISGSIAVLSDAVDSATDLVGGGAALLSVRISGRPADLEHPYGHGKVEGISASVAATIIAVGGGVITYQALRRIIEGSPDIDVGLGLIAMLIAALANVVVALLMSREARRSGSIALMAESVHLKTNVVQAGAIITGLVLVYVTGEPIFDPLTALALAAYMGWTAVALIRIAVDEVMDTALPAEDIEVIRCVIAEHSGEVRGHHQLRTRRSGTTRHVDMHLVFDASRTVEQVHAVSDAISEAIHTRLPGSIVVIHVEPDEGVASVTVGQAARDAAPPPDHPASAR